MPLTNDLRQYNATFNACGAHAMMNRAADALDARDEVIKELVKALTLVTEKVPMISAIRMVADIALSLAQQERE